MAGRVDITGDWQRVSERYVRVKLLGNAIGALFFGALAAVPLLLPFYGSDGPPLWLWTPLAVVVVIAIWAAIIDVRHARNIGWIERADDLLVRKGVLFRRFVAVPYGRMQVVDITQGPVERIFGLKTLKLVTAAASSDVVIPGLAGDAAEQLRDRLVAVSESRRAGL